MNDPIGIERKNKLQPCLICVRRIIKQIEKQIKHPHVEFYDTLNTLYFELYLEIDEILKDQEA